jgi:xanthine dehydrogenase/oxidase
VRELTSVEITDAGVKLGAAVTLNDMELTLRSEINKQPEHKTRVFLALSDMLDLFAGKQIRNVAGIGGNIMTGSPISDLNPIFLASGCTLEVHSKERGVRTVNMEHGFFTGYRKNVIQPDEILVSILVPNTQENDYFAAYKQAKRRDDDIAIVNAAFRVHFQPNSDK